MGHLPHKQRFKIQSDRLHEGKFRRSQAWEYVQKRSVANKIIALI
jgi:hypothetical protein